MTADLVKMEKCAKCCIRALLKFMIRAICEKVLFIFQDEINNFIIPNVVLLHMELIINP